MNIIFDIFFQYQGMIYPLTKEKRFESNLRIIHFIYPLFNSVLNEYLSFISLLCFHVFMSFLFCTSLSPIFLSYNFSPFSKVLINSTNISHSMVDVNYQSSTAIELLPLLMVQIYVPSHYCLLTGLVHWTKVYTHPHILQFSIYPFYFFPYTPFLITLDKV